MFHMDLTMKTRTFTQSLAKLGTWSAMACLFAYGSMAMAITTTAADKTQHTADNKTAATQYEADKKLCAEETSSSARLQCRRDANAAYTKALAEEKSRMTPTSQPAPALGGCPGCGTVVAVSVVEKDGEGGAVGMIAGGLGGAILGHQVGGGVGKDLATIAGAAGGAYAGKKIEGKVRAQKVWNVTVQYPDDSKKHFSFKSDPGYKSGDAVKNAGNSIVRR